MKKCGTTIGVVMAVAVTAAGCDFLGLTGRHVQARWVSGRTEVTLPEVKPGVEEKISFEMEIDQGGSTLRLEIAQNRFKDMGISIPDGAVAAVNGKVSATVRFAIKTSTSARRYVLRILARDAATGRIVAKAEMPFAVYPYSIERLYRCSC